ncbi:MAG TPA: ATP-binding protein, partial [Nitrospirota bacterium]|nr:ATP-binding protein [Nitrospirota bacterium]
MNWLMPAAVASLTGTLLLSLVYFYLYTQDRQRYLVIWCASWAIYSIRFCFLILEFLFGKNIVFDLGYYEFNLLGGPLLVWGVSMFLGRGMSKVWIFSTSLLALWIPLAIVEDFSFFSLTFPAFTFLAIIYIWTGIAFIRSQNLLGFGKYFVGWTFIIWGIHKGDYPLLRQVAWFAPWGYSFGESFAVMAAIGMLLIYFEKVKTELLINQDKLKQSEKFIHNILETVDEGFIVVDRDMKILSANRAYLTTVGMTIENVVGKHCYELTHHVNDSCYSVGEDCSVRRTFETGKPQSSLHTHHDAVRGHVYVETKAYPLYDGSGNIVSAIETISDTTEKKALEGQLRQAQKMEAIGTLAGGIAHDFNNILSAIIGYGSLLKMKMKSDDPLRLNVDHILESSSRAAQLTQGLLAFSRKQIIRMTPVHLHDIIQRVQKLLVRIIGEDVSLEVTLYEKELDIFADSGQIEQVLMNLATNARDAMPSGGSLYITTKMIELDEGFIRAHGYGKNGTYALISVTDHGCGIDAITLKKIFEPFFTTKDVGKGTGLGLAIVYGIVKQHDGYVNVYSEPGIGTTFKIYLPLIKADVDAAAPREPERAEGGSETILVAEDDKSLRELVSSVLKEFGYRVIEAKDGEEALYKFQENQDAIDLVVLDVIMPRMNGKEVGDAIKKMHPQTKILFQSGYPLDSIQQKGLFDGAELYVNKPISP